jgi:hypothetical protein
METIKNILGSLRSRRRQPDPMLQLYLREFNNPKRRSFKRL